MICHNVFWINLSVSVSSLSLSLRTLFGTKFTVSYARTLRGPKFIVSQQTTL